MNRIQLVGQLDCPPVYFCTQAGQDLCRLRLRVPVKEGVTELHYCTAWGPAAIQLHSHLKRGDAIALSGELRYRRDSRRDRGRKKPYVYVRSFRFL
jgi:single-stranded DNA-binding protein